MKKYPVIYFGPDFLGGISLDWIGKLRRYDLLSVSSQFFYAYFVTDIYRETHHIKVYRDLPKKVWRAIDQDYNNGLNLFPVFMEIKMVLPVVLGQPLMTRFLDFEISFLLQQISLVHRVDLMVLNHGESEANETVDFFLLI